MKPADDTSASLHAGADSCVHGAPRPWHPARVTSAWASTAAGQHLSGRRNTGTAPEIELRKALHAIGARFRLQRRIAPSCTADVVLPSRRVAVFVDGCWWHSCPRHGRTTPFTGPNADLWERKMARTRERDAQAVLTAQACGWTPIRVWECEVRADPALVARRVLDAGSGPLGPSPTSGG